MRAEHATEISAALNKKFWRVRLPDQLEQDFEAGTVVMRSRVLAGWLAFPLAYDLVNLVIDIVNHKLLSEIGIIGIGLAVLITAAAILLLARPPVWLASLAVVGAHIADVVCTTYIGLHIPFPFADRVVTNSGFIVLIVNVTSPLRFRDAVIFSVTSVLAYGWLLLGPLDHLGVIQADNVVHSAVFALISLAVLHRRERSSRQTFLLGALDQLRLREVAELSETDALTALPNRRAFDTTLERQWSLARASGELLGLLMIDVDHFKQLNDRRGHAEGDRTLKNVAAAMRAVMRSGTDVIARFGGEEFAVVLRDTSAAAVQEVAERVRLQVEQAALQHPVHGVVTVSVGGALIQPSRCNSAPDALVEAADTALYLAKQAGRNRVAIAEDVAALPG